MRYIIRENMRELAAEFGLAFHDDHLLLTGRNWNLQAIEGPWGWRVAIDQWGKDGRCMVSGAIPADMKILNMTALRDLVSWANTPWVYDGSAWRVMQ